MVETHSEIKALSIELLEELSTMLESYHSRRETGIKGDFFTEVKPYADSLNAKVGKWRVLSIKWVEEVKPKHLHTAQIQSAADQLEQLSVQAFFPETSLSRFTQTSQSVKYILNQILELTKT